MFYWFIGLFVETFARFHSMCSSWPSPFPCSPFLFSSFKAHILSCSRVQTARILFYNPPTVYGLPSVRGEHGRQDMSWQGFMKCSHKCHSTSNGPPPWALLVHRCGPRCMGSGPASAFPSNRIVLQAECAERFWKNHGHAAAARKSFAALFIRLKTWWSQALM